uniref:Neurogenic mastermind-like N-terminal domain-containing protein n=1 Tax=Knipowitschia caucasica TaxID=637954 RepID=A0AAV2J0F4_KNICA
MGEATPAQSSAGPFASTLGMGLGSAARGSAVPQLHNAIVERLRARIELCRRHHSTCENRYQRVQAESTDREHENTLHLLNIVHQGPGNRKSKGSRASHQQPPDYSRATGEHKGSEAEQKVSTRIALGSLRRKIEGHGSMQTAKQNGLLGGFSAADYKRMRLDSGLGQGLCNMNQSMPGPSLNMQRMMPHGVSSDIFNTTLKEMKKEPMDNPSCGQSHSDMIFDFKDFKDFKDEGASNIDPELQDLFDELTKSVPPLNDLEFEKMLKQDDTFGLDLGRPSSAGAAGSLCSPLDRPIKLEHSPDFGHVHSCASQLRPASAGPSFTLSGTSPNGTSQKSSSQVGPPRSLPCWPEISHAEQLKQMAANQHQPGSMLHHQSPGAGMSWASAVNSSSSSFTQDKLSSPLSAQRNIPPNKNLNNCLFKSNGHAGAHPPDMKMLNMKPSLHFSPKAGPQPMSMPSAMAKTPAQAQQHQQQRQQAPSPNQSQTHSSLHFQDHITGPLCLPNKASPPLGGGPFKPSQPRQAGPTCPKLHMNGSLGVMGTLTQPRPPVPNSQQKLPVKNQGMLRPLLPPQHAAEKDAHEQFSRHLTRPPPEYKLPRSIVGLNRGNPFTGPPSAQQTSNGPASELQSMSCQITSTPKTSSSDDRFGNCLPNSCLNQFQPSSNSNKPHFLGMNSLGNSFGLNNVQHGRPEMHAGQGSLISNVNMGWGPANKQVTSGMRRLPNPSQMDMPNLSFQQRHLGPPNQVAPDLGILRHNPTLRDINPRPNQAIMSQSALNQASPEQRVPAAAFGEPGDNTVPGINTDSDFIESLLKSGSGNDDWMKDINLDEILGSHT